MSVYGEAAAHIRDRGAATALNRAGDVVDIGPQLAAVLDEVERWTAARFAVPIATLAAVEALAIAVTGGTDRTR